MNENTTNQNVNTQNESTNTITTTDNSVTSFLKQNVDNSLPTKEIKFNRFSAAFKIQALTGDEVKGLQSQATISRRDPRTQQTIKSVDQDKLVDLMLAKSVINPPLDNEELQKSWDCIADPAGLLRKMLLAGEYTKLGQEVQSLSGFYEDINKDIDAAKK